MPNTRLKPFTLKGSPVHIIRLPTRRQYDLPLHMDAACNKRSLPPVAHVTNCRIPYTYGSRICTRTSYRAALVAHHQIRRAAARGSLGGVLISHPTTVVQPAMSTRQRDSVLWKCWRKPCMLQRNKPKASNTTALVLTALVLTAFVLPERQAVQCLCSDVCVWLPIRFRCTTITCPPPTNRIPPIRALHACKVIHNAPRLLRASIHQHGRPHVLVKSEFQAPATFSPGKKGTATPRSLPTLPTSPTLAEHRPAA